MFEGIHAPLVCKVHPSVSTIVCYPFKSFIIAKGHKQAKDHPQHCGIKPLVICYVQQKAWIQG